MLATIGSGLMHSRWHHHTSFPESQTDEALPTHRRLADEQAAGAEASLWELTDISVLHSGGSMRHTLEAEIYIRGSEESTDC